jgi:hypothetical protein
MSFRVRLTQHAEADFGEQNRRHEPIEHQIGSCNLSYSCFIGHTNPKRKRGARPGWPRLRFGLVCRLRTPLSPPRSVREAVNVAGAEPDDFETNEHFDASCCGSSPLTGRSTGIRHPSIGPPGEPPRGAESRPVTPIRAGSSTTVYNSSRQVIRTAAPDRRIKAGWAMILRGASLSSMFPFELAPIQVTSKSKGIMGCRAGFDPTKPRGMERSGDRFLMSVLRRLDKSVPISMI